jgi:hypothetical protein
MILMALLVGVGGGGWNIAAQTLPQAAPVVPTGVDARLDRAEMFIMENKITIEQQAAEDKLLKIALDQMGLKLDLLMQIAAANYAASTINSPSRQDAAKAAAAQIKRDSEVLLSAQDPLRLLGGITD